MVFGKEFLFNTMLIPNLQISVLTTERNAAETFGQIDAFMFMRPDMKNDNVKQEGKVWFLPGQGCLLHICFSNVNPRHFFPP